MNTSANNYDSLEKLIYDEGIRIKEITVHQDLDLMLIVLTTGGVLQEKISDYPGLNKASADTLKNYRLIGRGTGVHWPDLDEDLSLKVFLTDSIRRQATGSGKTA